MTPADAIAALGLPPQARVGQRIAKKLLLENGAPTATDRKLITEGVEELTWTAALKPETVGVPAFKDAAREYLEIAVLTLELRDGAKVTRLRELVHRAIPYPVVLVAPDDGATISFAHIRHAENEAGKSVLDGAIVRANLAHDAHRDAFLDSLSLANLRQSDLRALYQDWIDRVAALDTARVTGSFRVCSSPAAAERRRELLRGVERFDARIAALTADANKEKQLSRRIELNLELRKIKDERANLCDALAAGDAE